MANTKISDLPAVTDVLGTDEYVLSRSGVSKKIDAADLLAGSTGLPESGWVDAGETWTYASADSPTFTFTVAADVTTKYSPGMRLQLTQTTVKYFVVTGVSTFSGGNTTITVYGGTDYTLANAAITAPFYSVVKAPFGFPLSPLKWTVEVTDTADRGQATPTASVWYNPGSITISAPIGVWRLFYEAVLDCSDTGAGATAIFSTLSTANNSEVDKAMTSLVLGSGARTIANGYREKFVFLTTKQSYFLNIMTNNAGTDSIDVRGDLATTVVRAVCAYL